MKSKKHTGHKKVIHLICNAHIDPVWLWHWDEGLAETLSTFRTAAQMCRKYDSFVFNHNESLLYEWIEQYDKELFEEIKVLVKQGRWHIMGGWFIQPDCNMPSGESFVRQILRGKNYFKEKFGVSPTTAINFDPFGHTKGLVQILSKSGYDSYLFGRPWQEFCKLPGKDFIWVGYDGSEIMAHRFANDPDEMYCTMPGLAASRIKKWLENYPEVTPGLITWGMGDHGGGPSRHDLNEINKLINQVNDRKILHSTPEGYFADLREKYDNLPRWDEDLNPWATGCYTSMVKIKQMHRRLENEYYMAEKMAVTAFAQKLAEYPEHELREALYDLLFSQFHDILPGSAAQEVEWTSQRLISHGLEIISRVKTRTFLALTSGQENAAEGEIPIFVYNPHPFRVSDVFECEFGLAVPDFSGVPTQVTIFSQESPILCQLEQEISNCNMVDWRKRVVFKAELEPGMSRFNCQTNKKPSKPKLGIKIRDEKYSFQSEHLCVDINCKTGLIDRYQSRGINWLNPNAFALLVIKDNADSWEQHALRYDKVEGSFNLMSPERSSQFSSLNNNTLPSVRIIEDGPVRTVVEAVFEYGDSFACQRYKLPKRGSEIEVEIRVYWNEKERMLKLMVPVKGQNNHYIGQVAYGRQQFPTNGNEVVSQKWNAVICDEQNWAATCINEGCYASDYSPQEWRLTLLRSPAFACGPTEKGDMITQDRFSPRMDQGENIFRFWFNCTTAKERLENIDREALTKNEKPYALSYFPSGRGCLTKPLFTIDDGAIQITAVKKSEYGDDIIVRLFEPTGIKRKATLKSTILKTELPVVLKPFEIKSFRIDVSKRQIWEVDLMEDRIS